MTINALTFLTLGSAVWHAYWTNPQYLSTISVYNIAFVHFYFHELIILKILIPILFIKFLKRMQTKFWVMSWEIVWNWCKLFETWPQQKFLPFLWTAWYTSCIQGNNNIIICWSRWPTLNVEYGPWNKTAANSQHNFGQMVSYLWNVQVSGPLAGHTAGA